MEIRSTRVPFLELNVRAKPPGVTLTSVLDIGGRIVDSSGVPLTSDRGDSTLFEGVDFDYKPYLKPFSDNPLLASPSRCPFGNPHDKPISGLEDTRLKENYRSVLAIMMVVRNEYIKTGNNPDTSRSLTIAETAEVLHAITYLPHYLVLRAKRPISADKVFHPAIIVASNSAGGAYGALEAHMKHLEKQGISKEAASPLIPDVVDMIAEAEKSKGMIGKKTVCPARPSQQRGFSSAVRDGIEVHGETFDITTLLNVDEIPALIRFGAQTYDGKDLVEIFGSLDMKVAKDIEQHIKGRHNPRKVRNLISEFMKTYRDVATRLTTHQMKINSALDREISVGVGMQTFEDIGFQMPAIMRRLKGTEYSPREPKESGPALVMAIR